MNVEHTAHTNDIAVDHSEHFTKQLMITIRCVWIFVAKLYSQNFNSLNKQFSFKVPYSDRLLWLFVASRRSL